MANITKIFAREILDSNGNPTVEVEVHLDDGTMAIAAVPSGASTGDNEAIELRDGDSARYSGKGVLNAVKNVNELIAPMIVGKDVTAQRAIDQMMITADTTPNKSKLGANAILGVSMAVCRAAAISAKQELYHYIGNIVGIPTYSMPAPMILLMEGGKHGNWSTDVQEYMILPKKDAFSDFKEILRAGSQIFHALEKVLEEKQLATGVGFEGAYCPSGLTGNEQAFELILEAITKAGYKPGEQFVLAIDAAASEFFKDGNYVLKSEQNKVYTPTDWLQKVLSWVRQYPILSLEDPFDQEDWQSWVNFTSIVGGDHQVVGDDLVVTNVKRIQKAIDQKAMNCTLIKPNQIGTVTETLEAIALTKSVGFTSVVSHRSGETNDDFIADLVVGTGSGQSKFGGPDRGERLAKYNRLLRVEEQLS
ncbi:MAG TPA: phosphopyruvate hydratase [Patescibacteria group bacterium]|nr:phosphopyruvate hydratase [Patescibacteria group bacterium]